MRIELPQAQKLYALYEMTVTNPVSMDELFPVNGDHRELNDRFRGIYAHDAHYIANHIGRIHSIYEKNFDTTEPYDVGFFNAIKLAMFMIVGRPPEFVEKPNSQKLAIEKLQETVDMWLKSDGQQSAKHEEGIVNLHDTIEHYSERLSERDEEVKKLKETVELLEGRSKVEASYQKKAKAEIKKLKEEIKKAVPAPEKPKKGKRSKWLTLGK